MKTISNSPDISTLSFAALFDISLVTPTITLTNYSTGPNLAGCSWWYVIKSPSATFIHEGSEGNPDVNGTWASITVSDVWPQPAGTIEFSGAPYTVELFVKDTLGNIYSEELSQQICRPNGITANSGNFGAISVVMDVNCEKAKLFVSDSTNYMYKGNGGTQFSKTFVLDYPADETGNRPAQFVANDFTNVIIPVPFSSPGYTLYATAVYNYQFESGISVRVKYKLQKLFAVQCGIDLCPLVCSFNELIQDIENGKCKWDYEERKNKLELITSKLVMATIAKLQPACGIDLPALIEEIKVIGGFQCNCYVSGNGNNGILTGIENLNFEFNSSCGDVQGVFVQVGDNVKLNLGDKSYVINVGAGTTAAFNGAFTVIPSVGPNCQQVYTFNVDIDKLKTALNLNGALCCPICVNIYEHGVVPDTAPATCPSSFLPAYIYDYTDSTTIGYATAAEDIPSILNADPSWNDKGIAFNAGNCKVCFRPLNGTTTISPVYVTLDDGTNPPPNPGNYVTKVQDKCNAPTLSPMTAIPGSFYVQYVTNGPLYFIGYCNTYGDIITNATAEPNKPINITILGMVNTNPAVININVLDSNLPAGNDVLFFSDKTNVVLMGGNGSYGDPTNIVNGAEDVLYIDTAAQIGKICGGTNSFYKPWHTVLQGNLLTFIESDQGSIRNVDVTDPLNPIVLPGYSVIGLIPSAINVPFSGVPAFSVGRPSHWDAYFPTDINAQFDGAFTYLVESTSGTIYKYSPATNALIAYYGSDKLLGMCPRVIYNNKLYLTWDGSRDTLAGAGALNPVPKSSILIVDLSSFGASSYTIIDIDPGESMWGMSVDVANPGRAFITAKSGNIYRYDMNADAATNTYVQVTPDLSAADFINTVIYKNTIYVSAYGVGTYLCTLHTLNTGTASSFAPLPTTPGPTNVNHLTFTPLPNSCMGVLTFDNGAANGGVAKYGLDGSYLGKISIPGSMFNVVIKNGIISPTPNTLCP